MILECSKCHNQIGEGEVIRVSKGTLRNLGYDFEAHAVYNYCSGQCFLDTECDAAREAGLKDE
jgi:hypothetical protein